MADLVIAVVVTYNRARLLIECLDALKRQTRRIDKVVLVDNASTDDTSERLRQHGFLDDEQVDLVRLSVNTGGAGGFAAGVQRAVELGADWIWVMDDDAEPFDDALERLQPAFSRQDIAGAAGLTLGLDGKPQLEHRGWLKVCGLTPRAHVPITPTVAAAAQTEISYASFVGLAFPRRAVERIGLPKREMFIKADDLEYCVRLSRLGPILLMADSKVRHKDAVSVGYQPRRRLGMTSSRVPMEKLWLSYFSVRNLIWMRRHHCGAAVAAIYSLRQFSRQALGILLFDTERFIRLRFFYHAVADAWQDMFDNDKPRRLTRT